MQRFNSFKNYESSNSNLPYSYKIYEKICFKSSIIHMKNTSSNLSLLVSPS